MVRDDGDVGVPADEVARFVQGGGNSKQFSFNRRLAGLSFTIEASSCHYQSPIVGAAESFDIMLLDIPRLRMFAGNLIQCKTGA